MTDMMSLITPQAQVVKHDDEEVIETSLTGEVLLDNPLLNKGSAFSAGEARASIWMLDSQGLLHHDRTDLDSSKLMYAQPAGRTDGWHGATPGQFTLEDVVRDGRHCTPRAGTAHPVAASARVLARRSGAGWWATRESSPDRARGLMGAPAGVPRQSRA